MVTTPEVVSRASCSDSQLAVEEPREGSSWCQQPGNGLGLSFPLSPLAAGRAGQSGSNQMVNSGYLIGLIVGGAWVVNLRPWLQQQAMTW